jgi:anti-anti-sigma factor
VAALAREQAFGLLLSVLDGVHAESTFPGALQATLSRLLAKTGWIHAEAWAPDDDKKTLAIVAAHSSVESDRSRIAPFAANGASLRFARGEGLPGRVLATAQREWLRDVTRLDADTYRRAGLAREAGLHAALAVPVLAGLEVVAVLVLYMGAPQDHDDAWVELIDAAARELGTVLRRALDREAVERLEIALERLSTPILEVGEHVALVPVAGELDTTLANALTQRVLTWVERKRARVVLVDVTGVRTLDTANVAAILDLSRALRILGTRTIVTGIRAQFARALVHLGVSMSELETETSLAAGLQRANEIAALPIAQRSMAKG